MIDSVPVNAPDEAEDINLRIAARVRGERAVRRWSLDELAERARVSKAMISKIERAEVSPTAALLGKLSGAYGITLSALLADPEERRGPLRHADQPVWRDPDTGYVRRQVSASANTPVELTEVGLPPGAAVSFPASSYAFISQVMWVLSGRLSFVEEDVTHDLGPGDSYELGAPMARTFRNDGTEPCRYLVVVLRR